MTPLARKLLSRIEAQGPLTVADYMGDCLLHPQYGYYATRDPFGAAGDFITAPEISQMFGEMLGLCLAQSWLDQGAPAAFILAELGPGRGTLMADALRAARIVPGFTQAAQLHLVEASAHLRGLQADALQGYAPTWHDQIEHLPEGMPLFAVANEFFDALPIRQFQRAKQGWHERMITNDGGTLAMALAPAAPPPMPALRAREADTDAGELIEICTPALQITQTLARRIATDGGAALIIDYGDWRLRGDTWQAMAGHAHVDPLASPGEADLTAHVDFAALAEAATDAGAQASAMVTQGRLLETLGITARAQTLAQKLTGDPLTAHIAAHRRLTHPQEMGNLFKALALTPQGAPSPVGFEQ